MDQRAKFEEMDPNLCADYHVTMEVLGHAASIAPTLIVVIDVDVVDADAIQPVHSISTRSGTRR